MKGTPAHVARPRKTMSRSGPWSPPFPLGHEQNMRKLIAVEFLGATAEFTTYRILNLKCGHESIISHKRFMDKRNQSGCCQSCARQTAADTQKKIWAEKRNTGVSPEFDASDATWLEIWREKKRVELNEAMFFHTTWTNSLGAL